MSDTDVKQRGTPINTNDAQPNNLGMVLGINPDIVYWLQQANIPGVAANSPQQQQTHYRTQNHPASGVNFNPLRTTLKVDEDLSQWLLFYDLIMNIHHAFAEEDLKTLLETNEAKLWMRPAEDMAATTDVTLVYTTNKKNSLIHFVYERQFPISITDIDLITTDQGQEIRTCTIEWIYNTIKVKKQVTGLNPVEQNPAVKRFLEEQRRIKSGQQNGISNSNQYPPTETPSNP